MIRQRSGPPPAMPLELARRGDLLEWVGVGAEAGLRRRLAELGLAPGARLRVESGGGLDGVLVSVKGSRLILGRNLVGRVRVRPCSNPTGE